MQLSDFINKSAQVQYIIVDTGFINKPVIDTSNVLIIDLSKIPNKCEAIFLENAKCEVRFMVSDKNNISKANIRIHGLKPGAKDYMFLSLLISGDSLFVGDYKCNHITEFHLDGFSLNEDGYMSMSFVELKAIYESYLGFMCSFSVGQLYGIDGDFKWLILDKSDKSIASNTLDWNRFFNIRETRIDEYYKKLPESPKRGIVDFAGLMQEILNRQVLHLSYEFDNSVLDALVQIVNGSKHKEIQLGLNDLASNSIDMLLKWSFPGLNSGKKLTIYCDGFKSNDLDYRLNIIYSESSVSYDILSSFRLRLEHHYCVGLSGVPSVTKNDGFLSIDDKASVQNLLDEVNTDKVGLSIFDTHFNRFIKLYNSTMDQDIYDYVMSEKYDKCLLLDIDFTSLNESQYSGLCQLIKRIFDNKEFDKVKFINCKFPAGAKMSSFISNATKVKGIYCDANDIEIDVKTNEEFQKRLSEINVTISANISVLAQQTVTKEKIILSNLRASFDKMIEDLVKLKDDFPNQDVSDLQKSCNSFIAKIDTLFESNDNKIDKITKDDSKIDKTTKEYVEFDGELNRIVSCISVKMNLGVKPMMN